MTDAQSEQEPARGRGRLRLIPAPLAALLAVVFVFCVAWALTVPPGPVPDESHHIQYTQTITERHELPGDGPAPFSSEEDTALNTALRGGITFNLEKTPEWRRQAYDDWKDFASGLPRDNGGGVIFQGDNPPLYYAYESLAYWGGSGTSFFDRLHLMRIWSALLLLVTTTGAWLLAGEVFGRNRLLQLAAAALAGLQPMATFISSGVNPDAGLIAMWTIALWLGARIVRRGLTTRDGIALGLVAGFAVWVKATAWGFLPAALFAIAVGWVRMRERPGPHPRAPLPAALASLFGAAGGWVVTAVALGRSVVNEAPDYAGVHHPSLTSLTTLREFTSYVWQFYLPKLPFQTPFYGMGGGAERVYDSWLKTGWGTFGWLEVHFPDWTYSLIAIASALVILGGVTALARANLHRRVDPVLVAFLLLAGIGLMLVLHWADYTFITVQRHPVEQGRYLLPLISIGGLAVAGTVALLRRRWQASAVGVVLALLVTLQIASIGLTLGRYFG
ncbi:MAG: hypothetical protein QOG86_509 [Thermoleophilaceae bacterium]|nr:hypothetical protein [Thermoleophilaceae bacterium]